MYLLMNSALGINAQQETYSHLEFIKLWNLQAKTHRVPYISTF